MTWREEIEQINGVRKQVTDKRLHYFERIWGDQHVDFTWKLRYSKRMIDIKGTNYDPRWVRENYEPILDIQ